MDMSSDSNDPKTQPNADCEAARELIPAFCLGAADPEERTLVETALAQCPELAGDLAAYRSLTDGLLFSAPPVEAPASLGEQLLAAISPTASAKTPPPVSGIWRLSPVLAAAAVILLIVTNLYWFSQISDLRSQQDTLTALVTRQERLLRQFNRVELTAEAANHEGYGFASLVWAPEPDNQSWVVILSASDLPDLASDMAYQLWLVRGEERVSGGLFQVNDTGEGTLIFWTDEPVDTYDRVGITPEPASGSPGPTAPPVAIGQL